MNRRVACILIAVAAAGTLGVACSATPHQTMFTGSGGSSANSGSATGGASGTLSGGVGGGTNLTTSSGGTGASSACNPGPNEDFDKDGWSIAQGDCNDC